MEPEELTFQEIKEITDGFAQELGHGSFGVVYKGLTKTGKDIAVKVLHNDISIDYKQFHNEFNSLAMLQHQNIAQLLGYCYETERKPMKYNGRQVIIEETHRVLCLEYLQNGSLWKYLSGYWT
ncbi:cold-responsive protein kinase 1-like isoform X2 [Miscanthus floridulus]|uniref:cold-responsive protein kinase 1-like isoform X2 n=1 Tax=Miscanthus floridulus TaxID=154761 RepID=UPI00345A85B1